MATVKIQGLDDARALVANVGKQMPDVVWWAQSDAADQVKTALQTEIQQIFDRPTPLIVNGMRKVADKTSREIGVGWKDVYGLNEPYVEHRGKLYSDAVSRTLIPHIDGGSRSAKPGELQLRRAGILGADEYLVPSRTAPLDQYGNVKVSMSKIISDLGAWTHSGQPGQTKVPKRRYIFGKVGSTRGIFDAGGDILSASANKRNWKLIFLVVKGAPVYRKRFKFYETATTTFAAVFPREFDRIFTRELDKRS
jgi:hypothetical protein